MNKNIWVAAADGDLSIVQHYVDSQGLSPNVQDENTFTPMHTAASYGHRHVLDYLIAHGGDVNIKDDEGDTPLYTVEECETAKYLVDHGAIVDMKNLEGISPADYLEEDFPEVAAYLRSLLPPLDLPSDSTTLAQSTSSSSSPRPAPSQHAQNAASEVLTNSLLAKAAEIAQRGGSEDEIRVAVEQAVFQGIMTGYDMAEQFQTSHGDVANGGGAAAATTATVSGSVRPSSDDQLRQNDDAKKRRVDEGATNTEG